MRQFLSALVLVCLVAPIGLHASERQDIAPGEANWHRYRFHVITTGVAVRQSITVSWDNQATGMLIAVFDVDDPTKPSLQAISVGNDRGVTLDLGLMDGSYQIVPSAVGASTHYHLNVTYGNDELLFRQPNGPLRAQIELVTDRRISEQLAPYLAKLTTATTRVDR